MLGKSKLNFFPVVLHVGMKKKEPKKMTTLMEKYITLTEVGKPTPSKTKNEMLSYLCRIVSGMVHQRFFKKASAFYRFLETRDLNNKKTVDHFLNAAG